MTNLDRRTFLGAAGGLLVSVARRPAHAAEQGGAPAPAAPLPGSLKETPLLDAWVHIAPDGHVTVFTGKAELGQGIATALLQIAAEQLSLLPAEINLVTADTARTPNEGFTAGSHSMQDSGTAIMHAAAQVRALLTQAAATEWSLPPEQLTVSQGQVHAPDGRSLGFGPLAAKLDLHVEAHAASTLQNPTAYVVMNTPLPRIDIPAKLTGGQAYVQDLRLPGMLHARILRQPTPGATLGPLDTSAIERLPGVTAVIRRGDWLAVVAEHEWTAIKAERALAALAHWSEPAPLPDPATIHGTIQALPAREIPILTWSNQAAPPAKRQQARYTKPYLMHGAIGPSCAVAHLADNLLTVWTHTQGVYPLRGAIASLLRLPPGQVRCVHAQGSGCYGHNGADDVAGDAALLAQAMPGRPIRVQWMREDEHLNEPYGAAMVAEVQAALSSDGAIVDWDYGVWSNTHNRRPAIGGLMLQNAALPDKLPVPPPAPIPMPEGGGERNSNPIYAFPNARVVSHFIPEMPLRVSALRSLGAYLNVFAIESFMDELAEAAGADPVAFRLRHLTDERGRAVIQEAAARFGWNSTPSGPTPGPGIGRGFAFARYKNLGAYCAIALDLHVEHETGQVRLGRIVAAVDSGQPVNPDGIRNQIEGAIIQSASWTLYEQVRWNRSRITSADWSGYPVIRFPAIPSSIEVHILPRPGDPLPRHRRGRPRAHLGRHRQCHPQRHRPTPARPPPLGNEGEGRCRHLTLHPGGGAVSAISGRSAIFAYQASSFGCAGRQGSCAKRKSRYPSAQATVMVPMSRWSAGGSASSMCSARATTSFCRSITAVRSSSTARPCSIRRISEASRIPSPIACCFSTRQRAAPAGNIDPPPTASRYSQITGLSNTATPSSVTRHGTFDSGFIATSSAGEAWGLDGTFVIRLSAPVAIATAITFRT